MTTILILIAILIITFIIYISICESTYDLIHDIIIWVSESIIRSKFIRIIVSITFGVIFGPIIYVHNVNTYILDDDDSFWGMLAGVIVGPFILPFELYQDLTDNIEK